MMSGHPERGADDESVSSAAPFTGRETQHLRWYKVQFFLPPPANASCNASDTPTYRTRRTDTGTVQYLGGQQ
jgi:hypothetical protein